MPYRCPARSRAISSRRPRELTGLRVLHVIAGASTGGAETFALDAIEALADLGVEQKVICRPHDLALRRMTALGLPTVTMSFSPVSRYLGGRTRIRSVAEDWGPDIVHAWMARASSFVPRSGIGAAEMPCPVVGWMGGYYSDKYFRHCDAFIGVTPDICRHIRATCDGHGRTYLCHTFGTLRDDPPIRRDDLAIAPTATVLLMLSRMHHKKGVDTAIEAVRHLPDAVLLLAGDGPEMRRYQRLATARGVSDRVRFLGWRTDRRALLELCDICLLPSRYEPFGTVIAEAWSMRRPLITTPADGPRQYVVDGEDALVVPFDEPAELASAVNRLSQDRDLGARLVDAGYRKYVQQFSREPVLGDLLAVYRRVITSGQARIDVAELDARLISAVTAEMLTSEPGADARRISAAVLAAIAYWTYDEGQDTSLARDAALVELSGLRRLVGRQACGRSVLILDADQLDATLAEGDRDALAKWDGTFCDRLLTLLNNPYRARTKNLSRPHPSPAD